jgi:hypothetical protein
MTDKPIRREFLKIAACPLAILAIRPTRDGNQFFKVQSHARATSESELLVRAIQAWRPNPALKIVGFECGVSEHFHFLNNQLTVRVIAETRLTPPSWATNPRFATYFSISRPYLNDPELDWPHLLRWVNATLNAEGAFKWVGEGETIPEAPIVLV